MLQYYTLEEAAKLLDVNPDRAKKLLDDHRVRQYRDGRGKARYVASAVDELARNLGRGSDPDLPLGEAPRPKAGSSPRPTKATEESGETFDFNLAADDSAEVALGAGLDESDSASKKSGRSSSKSPSPKSPAPKSGHDSDVRLVTDSRELAVEINPDSDVKMVDEDSPSSSHVGSKSGGSKSGSRKDPGESDVRIVPMDVASDSDVHIADEGASSVELGRPPAKKHSDSDIRLEEAASAAPHRDEGSDDSHVTEDIDLDAEQRRAAETAKAKGKGKIKKSDKSSPTMPAATSPFELSDEVKMPQGGQKKPDSSSDFELTPAAEDSDDSVEISSGELAAIRDEDSSSEEVDLGTAAAGTGTSGINLDAPADSGISLEDSSESGDQFELALDSGKSPKPGAKSPKPGAKSPKPGSGKKPKPPVKEEDSDSEFELTLDADSSDEQPKLQPTAEDSDSEFELTLDDSGGLVPMEGEKSGKHAKAAKKEEGEGDIFETDFEVPALDDESGSEAVALDEGDTDLESSDFDLALDEGDAGSAEESGSQVVALEDEAEVDEAAETVQRPRKKAARQPAAAEAEAGEEVEAIDELAGVEDEEAVAEVEGEEVPARRTVAVAAAPAEWGSMPALVLLPCVIVLLLAGFMGYELINTMVGYHQPGKVTGFLAESMAKAFDLDLPKD
jgi:hypothetical protein